MEDEKGEYMGRGDGEGSNRDMGVPAGSNNDEATLMLSIRRACYGQRQCEATRTRGMRQRSWSTRT